MKLSPASRGCYVSERELRFQRSYQFFLIFRVDCYYIYYTCSQTMPSFAMALVTKFSFKLPLEGVILSPTHKTKAYYALQGRVDEYHRLCRQNQIFSSFRSFIVYQDVFWIKDFHRAYIKNSWKSYGKGSFVKVRVN